MTDVLTIYSIRIIYYRCIVLICNICAPVRCIIYYLVVSIASYDRIRTRQPFIGTYIYANNRVLLLTLLHMVGRYLLPSCARIQVCMVSRDWRGGGLDWVEGVYFHSETRIVFAVKSKTSGAQLI